MAKNRKEKEPKAVKANKEKVRGKKNRSSTSPIRNLIIFAIASVLVGVGFIMYPNTIQKYCGYIIGGVVALIGLVSIICYFAKKMVDGVYRSEFVVGMLAVAAGAYVALLSNGTMSFILIVLGILCAADGLMKIQYTLDLARMHYSKWWICLIAGVIGLGLGVVIIMGLLAKMAGSDVVDQMTYIGAGFCLNCVLDIVALVVIAVRNSKAAKAAAQTAAANEMSAAAQASVPQPAPEPVPAPQPIPEPIPVPQPVPAPVQTAQPVYQPVPAPQSAPAPQSVPTPEPVPQEPVMPEPVQAEPAVPETPSQL